MPLLETRTDRFSELLDLLEKATAKEQMHWEETPEDGVYRAVISAGIVRLAHEVPWLGVPIISTGPRRYTLTLLSQKNEVIERFVAEGGAEEDRISELYGKVRRTVLHLDQAYEWLLEDLRRRAGK